MITPIETKQALERADRLVAIAPERGRRTYANRAIVEAGTLCSIEEKGCKFMADAGRGLGGGDEAPTPSALLRSALSSCIAIGVKMWAARRDVPVDCVEVTLETDSDARGVLGLCAATPPGFTGLRVRIDVQSPAAAERVHEIVALSQRYSPLLDVIANPQQVETYTRVHSPLCAKENGRVHGS